MKEQRTIDNNSLSHIIAEKITEQIMTGELKPGEKVVETVYADEFGTSRAPIREALYLLTIEGLIERTPRKGATVKGYTEAEIYDLLEIRMMLEALAMERIAVMPAEEICVDKMEKLIPEMEKAEQDNIEYAKLNQEYHLALIEMTKSEIIKGMYSRLGLPLLSLQRMTFLEEKNTHKSVREHRLINKLLREHNVAEAKDVLQKHNADVIERVKSKLSKKE
ncbi:GntR family transcriptional regulator [Bacillus piscicola]|uniref:GntR family transcriptional regulator n=1 Tax=Bacillus piscicola TaxID=1632684 RepID=UPI001F0997FD